MGPFGNPASKGFQPVNICWLRGDTPGDEPMLRDVLIQLGLAVFVTVAIGGILYFEAFTLMTAPID
jgi:hypothetical protein